MRVNQVLVSKKGCTKLLIVGIDLENGIVAVTDLRAKKPARPTTRNIKSIQMDIKEGKLFLENHLFPPYFYKKDSELPEKWIEIRDQAHEAIKDLVDNPAEVYKFLFGDKSGIFKSLVSKLVKKKVKEGTAKKYIATAINRYFAQGGCIEALLPMYANCGRSPTTPQDIAETPEGGVCLASKRGAPTKFGSEPYGYATQKIIDNIEKFSKSIKNGDKVVLRHLYHQYLEKYHLIHFKRKDPETGKVFAQGYALEPKCRLISLRVFKYHLQKFVPKIEFLRKEVGQITYDRDHAAKTRVAWDGLRGAADRYEIDTTVADVYIRYPHSDNEKLAIGRPIVYLVVDTLTGMIVGLHVAFDGPNWAGTAQALFNAMSDKAEFCSKYGIDINHSDWPCNIPPTEINMDRGNENPEKNIVSLLKTYLGVFCGTYNAYHRGDAKGVVEKSFDILQSNTLEFEAGKVVKAPSKEAQHASRKSIITLEGFMKTLITEILFQNNKKYKICADNLKIVKENTTTAREAWNWHLENSSIKQPVDRKILRAALLPEGNATLTGDGVKFRGLFFSSNKLHCDKTLDEAKRSRKKIKVRYTDLSVKHIWLINTETLEVDQLDLCKGQGIFGDFSWASELHRLALNKHAAADGQFNNDVERVNTNVEQRAIMEEEKEQAKHLQGSEAKSMEQGMNERKSEIVVHQRAQEAAEIHEDLSPSDKPSPSKIKTDSSYIDPTIPSEDA